MPMRKMSRRLWNNDELVDSVGALAVDREDSEELCSRTTFFDEDLSRQQCQAITARVGEAKSNSCGNIHRSC
ncbi:hypothetical protein RB195_003347 [Necator americanus]|uniref:Uncharacterized protein n=1 Tax=Necator americanus TaxID=51031 RepID=A0ABR1DN41_NECAM